MPTLPSLDCTPCYGPGMGSFFVPCRARRDPDSLVRMHHYATLFLPRHMRLLRCEMSSSSVRWSTSSLEGSLLLGTRKAPVSLVARHGRVLERSRFRGPASSERARELAFQQPELADPAPGDEFPEMEYEEVPDFPKCVPSCFLYTLGVLSIMVVSCGARTFCYSKRDPRFEQCNLLVKDIGICVYFSCSTGLFLCLSSPVVYTESHTVPAVIGFFDGCRLR